MRRLALAIVILGANGAGAAELLGSGNDGMFELAAGGGSFVGGNLSLDTTLLDDIKLQFGTGVDYWWLYDATGTKLCLYTTNNDGGGSDGTIMCIDDGDATIDVTSRLIVPVGTAASPSLAWGDGDTGFHELTDDNLEFTSAGTARFYFTSAGHITFSTGGRPQLRNATATSSVPNIIPDNGDVDTGLGQLTNELYLIAGGIGMVSVGTTNTTTNGTIYADEVGAYGTVAMYDVSDPYAEGAGGTVNVDASGASGDCSAATAWVLISDATDCVAGTLFNFTNSNCVLTSSRTHRAKAFFNVSFDGSAGDDIFIGVADNASLPPSPICQTKHDASAATAANSASGSCDILATTAETISLYYCNQTTVTADINITRMTLSTTYLGDD